MFSNRLWISTTNKWGPNATEAIKNQNPPVTEEPKIEIGQKEAKKNTNEQIESLFY